MWAAQEEGSHLLYGVLLYHTQGWGGHAIYHSCTENEKPPLQYLQMRETEQRRGKGSFPWKVIPPQKTPFCREGVELQFQAVRGEGAARPGPRADQWNEGLELGAPAS